MGEHLYSLSSFCTCNIFCLKWFWPHPKICIINSNDNIFYLIGEKYMSALVWWLAILSFPFDIIYGTQNDVYIYIYVCVCAFIFNNIYIL